MNVELVWILCYAIQSCLVYLRNSYVTFCLLDYRTLIFTFTDFKFKKLQNIEFMVKYLNQRPILWIVFYLFEIRVKNSKSKIFLRLGLISCLNISFLEKQITSILTRRELVSMSTLHWSKKISMIPNDSSSKYLCVGCVAFSLIIV
jgi:hypothetical protein